MEKVVVWKSLEDRARLLDRREQAYILDKISGSSFYIDEFGELSPQQEEKLIVSIFGKIQFM